MTKTKKLEVAFRHRAGVIGMLQACRCEFPLRYARTKTGHARGCPGGKIAESQEAAAERERDLAAARDGKRLAKRVGQQMADAQKRLAPRGATR